MFLDENLIGKKIIDHLGGEKLHNVLMSFWILGKKSLGPSAFAKGNIYETIKFPHSLIFCSFFDFWFIFNHDLATFAFLAVIPFLGKKLADFASYSKYS